MATLPCTPRRAMQAYLWLLPNLLAPLMLCLVGTDFGGQVSRVLSGSSRQHAGHSGEVLPVAPSTPNYDTTVVAVYFATLGGVIVLYFKLYLSDPGTWRAWYRQRGAPGAPLQRVQGAVRCWGCAATGTGSHKGRWQQDGAEGVLLAVPCARGGLVIPNSQPAETSWAAALLP